MTRRARRGVVAGIVVATLLLGMVESARGQDLMLEPSGARSATTAAWVPGQGPGSSSDDQILLLRKDSSEPGVGAIVVVKGVDGIRPTQLHTLAWDRRTDSTCSPRAPRWGIGIEGRSGSRHVAYLTCDDARHSPTTLSQWTHDELDQHSILAAIRKAGGADAEQGTVRALAILFTDGPGAGPGFAYLDNVTVNETVWRSEEPSSCPDLTLCATLRR